MDGKEGQARRNSDVFAKDTEDFSLNTYVCRGSKDGGHFSIGRLKTNHVIALTIEALEGGIGSIDESDDYFSFAGSAGSFDQDVVSGDDVLIAHGVATNLEGEDFAVADDVVEGDGFGGLDGFNGFACGNPPHEGEAIRGSLGASREHIDGTAAIVRALEQALVLQICDVFVNCGERA